MYRRRRTTFVVIDNYRGLRANDLNQMKLETNLKKTKPLEGSEKIKRRGKKTDRRKTWSRKQKNNEKIMKMVLKTYDQMSCDCPPLAIRRML